MLKRGCIILVLSVIQAALVAQTKASFEPLAGYDFQTGAYALLFTPVRQDSAFYLTDVQSLSRLQYGWKFTEEAVTYPFACNDGFEILLLEDDIPVNAFSVRLRCEAFVSGKEWWHFQGVYPAAITGIQPLAIKDTTYQSLQQAREALVALRQNGKVVYVQPPLWESYEGFFFFDVPNPNQSGKAPTVPWEELEAQVRQDLDMAYPEQPYTLELSRYGYGKHYPNVGFRLTAHKSFFDGFKLYPIGAWGWRPLPLKLTYYHRP